MIGSSIVDFVIVYESCGKSNLRLPSLSENRYNQQSVVSKIIKVLLENDLHITHEAISASETETTTPKQIHYIKIAATEIFLKYAAEVHKIRIPVTEVDVNPNHGPSKNCRIFGKTSELNEIKFVDKYYYSVRFLRQLEDIYNIKTTDGSIFTESQRILLIWKTLESITIQTDDLKTGQLVRTSISELLQDNVLSAVYPIHDSHYTSSKEKALKQPDRNKRAILHNTWAKFNQWDNPQPFDNISYYFGTQTAIYFAFLGFYVKSLYILSTFALILSVCGIVKGSTDQTVNDVCQANVSLCPQCDPLGAKCVVKTMDELCTNSKISAMMDNPFTILYGFLTSLWCAVFTEFWKRRELQLACRWGTVNSSINDFNVRAQFKNKYKKIQPTIVAEDSQKSNHTDELFDVTTAMNLWSLSAVKRSTYYLRVICSVICVVIFIIVALCNVAGSTFLRIVIRAKMTDLEVDPAWEEYVLRNSATIGSALASVISAVVMLILNAIYGKVARRLNDFECLRTEQEYEKSFVYKFFVFQFINFFAGLFYTAFLKDTVGHSYLNRESCLTNGCLADIFIQLLIIMSIKQFINNFMEVVKPALQRRLKKLVEKIKAVRQNTKDTPRHMKDYYLDDIEKPALYTEYLELSIQYAFVTLFASICPPAAILASVNNIFEIRIDAQKMTKHYRRPIPLPARSIGPWFSVFVFITKVAILTNACLVAFGGTFIDKMVLQLYVNANAMENRTMDYIGFAYQPVETRAIGQLLGFDENRTQRAAEIIGPTCYIRNYKDLVLDQDTSTYYWKSTTSSWSTLAAKFIFVIAYVTLIYLIQMLIKGIIPDIPDSVKIRNEREQYLEQEAFMQARKKGSQDSTDQIHSQETLRKYKKNNSEEQKINNQVSSRPLSSIMSSSQNSNDRIIDQKKNPGRKKVKNQKTVGVQT